MNANGEVIPFTIADPYQFETIDYYPWRSRALLEILKSHLASTSGWRYEIEGIWTYVLRPGQALPGQGWKLHLSATPHSAPEVLERVLPVLLEVRTLFKFIVSTDLLYVVNAPYWPRGISGKFITIYPTGEPELRYLAERCYELTRGLDGPRVLSDRPYKPDGIVFYRYGAFKPLFRLGADGFYMPVMVSPSGEEVEDKRNPWFSAPPWTQDPFRPPQPQAPQPVSQPSSQGGLVLKERYRVLKARHFSNKGGLYKALDIHTGMEVILKEARPHVGTDPQGYDAVFRLQQEYAMLEKLASTGTVPRPLDLFEYGGHTFAAEELVPGRTLRKHLDAASNQPWTEVKGLIRKLVRLLGVAHERGVVLQDFTPNNVMVTPEGDLRLIDLELAFDTARGIYIFGGTPGYISPQRSIQHPPTVADDLFSLGAVLHFILTGRHPTLHMRDEAPGRSIPEQLGPILWAIAAERGLPAKATALVLELMDDDPRRRPTLEEVARRVDALPETLVARRSGRLRVAREAELAEGLAGVIGYIADKAQFAPSGGSHHRVNCPWPTNWVGYKADPISMQFGASGVGLFLLRAIQAHGRNDLEPLLRRTAEWCAARLSAEPNRPPGLYFGLAGPLLFLHRAARQLGDGAMEEQAAGLVAGLPTDYPLPDIAHGAAGIGLTHLMLFADTGKIQFLDKAMEVGEYLAHTVRVLNGSLAWPIPAEPHIREFSGKEYYGYAHGVAGIVTFLIYLSLASGKDRWLDLAVQGAHTLLRAALRVRGRWYWNFGPGDPRRWPHWCNGSSGVGTALVRLYRVTGEWCYLEAAMGAARAVMAEKWGSTLTQCHGLAGNGELLLDLWEASGDPRFRRWALHLAWLAYLHRIYYRGRCAFPGEGMLRLQADLGTGMAGVGYFLSRCLTAGSRMLMADELFDQRGWHRQKESEPATLLPA